MVHREVSVGRLVYRGGRGRSWSDDDGQRVTDGHGQRDYCFHHGLPCRDPTAPGKSAAHAEAPLLAAAGAAGQEDQ